MSSERSASRDWATAAILAGAAALLATSCRGGGDMLRYLQWAWAFASGDIQTLAGRTLSPSGVPVSQWSFGPGVLLSLGAFVHGLGSPGPQDVTPGGMLVGWVAALAMWWALLSLLHDAARGDRGLVVLGAGVAFLGTHLGYHSRVYAAESLGCALLALFALSLRRMRPSAPFDWLAPGACAAGLVATRPQLVVYVVALVLATPRATDETPSRAQLLRGGAIAGVPIACAVAMTALVNFWMTGSAFSSPYTFGAGEFSSVDPLTANHARILFGPLHGWLSFHPFYALGLAALVAELWRARARHARALGPLSLLAAIALHVQLQASWYAWWLGTNTFGMRALGIAAVVLVPAWTAWLAQTAPRSAARRASLGLALACCLWSLLLLFRTEQQPGNLDFFSWSELLASQGATLRAHAGFELGGVLLGVALGVVRRFRSRGGDGASVHAVGALLAALALWYLLRVNPLWRAPLADSPLGGGVMLALGALVAVVVAGERPALPLPHLRAARLVAPVLLSACVLLCARLALRTEATRSAEGPVPEGFRYLAPVHVDEIVATYREYLVIPGHEEDKGRLHHYVMKLLPEARKLYLDRGGKLRPAELRPP